MLQLRYKTKEEIPQEYVALYTEQGGEWVFTGITGMKTQGDVDKVMLALQKEREDHKATKAKLTAFEGMEADDVRTKLIRLEELETLHKDSIPKNELDKKLDELVEVRIKGRLMPIERQRDDFKKKTEELQKANETLLGEKTQRLIHDKVRAAAVTAKVLQTAEPDVLLLADAVFTVTDTGEVLTKDNPFGVSPGLSPDVFLTELQDKRAHWWPTNVGGGGKGGDGKGSGGSPNPWAAENWNITAQGQYLQQHGKEKAEQMAKMAGTTVGGPKPQKK